MPCSVIAIYLDGRVFRRAPQRFRRELMIPILASLPGVTISRAHQTLTIGVADADTANHLGIPLGAPVAFVRRVFRAGRHGPLPRRCGTLETIESGRATLTDAPGLGVTPDLDALTPFLVRH